MYPWRVINWKIAGFIIEVEDSNTDSVNKIFDKYNVSLELIGETSEDQKLIINDAINVEVEEMEDLWTNGLRDKIR